MRKMWVPFEALGTIEVFWSHFICLPPCISVRYVLWQSLVCLMYEAGTCVPFCFLIWNTESVPQLIHVLACVHTCLILVKQYRKNY